MVLVVNSNQNVVFEDVMMLFWWKIYWDREYEADAEWIVTREMRSDDGSDGKSSAQIESF